MPSSSTQIWIGGISPRRTSRQASERDCWPPRSARAVHGGEDGGGSPFTIALHVGRHGGPQTTEHDQKEEFVDAFSVVFDVEASGFMSDELRRILVGLSEEVTEEEMNQRD